MRAQTQAPTAKRTRRRTVNRRLPQRRPLRARLPSARQMGAALLSAAERAWPVLGALTIAALLGVGAWQGYDWLQRSSRFSVAEIVVTGNRRVSADDLRKQSGIDLGANVFTLDTRAAQRATTTHPWIARTEISRRLPQRLLLRVVEHEPAAVALLGSPYLVDKTGLAFKRALLDSDEVQGLPVITGLSRAFYNDNAHARKTMRVAIDIATEWKTESRPTLSEVNLSRSGITLFTKENAVAIRLGRPEPGEVATRLRRFDAVWQALDDEERSRLRVIHADSPARTDRVSVQLANAR